MSGITLSAEKSELSVPRYSFGSCGDDDGDVLLVIVDEQENTIVARAPVGNREHVEELVRRANAPQEDALRVRVKQLEEEARRYYLADGSYEVLDSAEEVVRRRVEAAKILAVAGHTLASARPLGGPPWTIPPEEIPARSEGDSIRDKLRNLFGRPPRPGQVAHIMEPTRDKESIWPENAPAPATDQGLPREPRLASDPASAEPHELPFETEWETYRRRLPHWLRTGEAGHWVAIRGVEVGGIGFSRKVAERLGRERFGEVPFLVAAIDGEEVGAGQRDVGGCGG